MQKYGFINDGCPVYLSKDAINSLEDKLSFNFEDMTMPYSQYKVNFQLTVSWIEDFSNCINELPNNTNQFIYDGKHFNYTMSFIDGTLGKASLILMRGSYNGKLFFLINDFVFTNTGKYKRLFEQRNIKGKDELSEFHSWMKRLDEVKGARHTYWCK